MFLTGSMTPIPRSNRLIQQIALDDHEYPGTSASRMGKRGFEVGDAAQEDGVRLMVMVGEEDELVPVVLAETELEKLVQGVRSGGGP